MTLLCSAKLVLGDEVIVGLLVLFHKGICFLAKGDCLRLPDYVKTVESTEAQMHRESRGDGSVVAFKLN